MTCRTQKGRLLNYSFNTIVIKYWSQRTFFCGKVSTSKMLQIACSHIFIHGNYKNFRKYSCKISKILLTFQKINKLVLKPNSYNNTKRCLCIWCHCTVHQELSLRLSWSNYWTHCLRWSWSVNRNVSGIVLILIPNILVQLSILPLFWPIDRNHVLTTGSLLKCCVTHKDSISILPKLSSRIFRRSRWMCLH